MKQIIKISVRNLVEFVLQEGDLDSRRGNGFDKDAMQMGNRIHRKIQRQMGGNYQAEVPLKHLISCDGFVLQVEGRADGISIEDNKHTVDEIKGILYDLAQLEEPVYLHVAQAKCYAYIYAKSYDLPYIDVQMTYCQMESEEVKRFVIPCALEELEVWFLDIVKQYEKWAKYQLEWRQIRNQSVRQIKFPYEYRAGQKHLATSVYKTMLRKKKLFIQAPTGVGKTMSCVFPAVKAMGEGLGDKLFYLTAKTITRTVAEQAFSILKQQQLKMKVITLTAKEKICFCEETICNPDYCVYAKGHFDRINDAVYELITSTDEMGRQALEEQAKKHCVCPFEMALDVSRWVDAIICDYNYVFDPTAHLKRFFSEKGQGNYLFLIDEAHNLVERGREMYSATLYKEDILEAKGYVKSTFPKLASRLEECNRVLLELKRECETYQVQESASAFMLKVMNAVSELEIFMEECIDETVREKLLPLYFDMNHFLNMYEKLDENYVIYTELDQSQRFKIKLFCVNPATNLSEYLEFAHSTIFFSATLLPIQYYRSLLSIEKEDYAIYAESPFDEKNRLLLVGKDVSTKYTRRGKPMYTAIASYIEQVIAAKTGNYLVFFPSYQIMHEVHDIFKMNYKDKNCIKCILQEQSMQEERREKFLDEFEQEQEGSLVGFCVMGGIFSEGIDLTEQRLIGAIIVGTGLPQVCPEREILKDYFDERKYKGFDYAYLYPGINKVMQAAGRVIRTEQDQGLILLLDDRFLNRQYQETFPREWKGFESCTIAQVADKINLFWI